MDSYLNTKSGKRNIYYKPRSEKHLLTIKHLKAKSENLLESIKTARGTVIAYIAVAQFDEAEQYILKHF